MTNTNQNLPLDPRFEDPPLVFLGPHEPGSTVPRQYMGTLSDRDAKSLITRSFNTTKEEASAVDMVVGSPLTMYVSHGDFVRHAVWELLRAYEQMGFPNDYLPDITAHLKNMRESANRLRLRQEFSDILTVYETSLTDGLETGDYDLIDATFDTLEGYVTRTPDPHWKHFLRRTILRSGVVKAAVDALYEVARDEVRYQRASERWQVWMEGLADD